MYPSFFFLGKIINRLCIYFCVFVYFLCVHFFEYICNKSNAFLFSVMPPAVSTPVTSNVVPLITCNGGAYGVDESTLQWLEGHDKPVAIVACAGKYRTGKSFLLNRLANAPAGRGFGVGGTVQACTKGLWVYKQFFDYKDYSIVFVDTEGIDALDADNTHDARIFTLALLLSSTFLYNSIGHIDEAAMQTLSLMTRVTQNVKVSSETDDRNCRHGVTLSSHMPHFVWILRDFALKLTSRNGSEMTPDQYLEEAVQASEGDCSRSNVRDTIRTLFPNRNLVTLQRPVKDDAHIQTLETKLNKVAAKFTSSVDALRCTIFASSSPQIIHDMRMTGSMIAEQCRYLVRTVQGGAVPVIQDSWTLLSAVYIQKLSDQLVASFTAELQRLDCRSGFFLGSVQDVCASIERETGPIKEKYIEQFKESQMSSPNTDRLLAAEVFTNKIDAVVSQKKSEWTAKANTKNGEIQKILARFEAQFYRDPVATCNNLKTQMAVAENICTACGLDPTWCIMLIESMTQSWIPNLMSNLNKEKASLNQELKASQQANSLETHDARNETANECQELKSRLSDISKELEDSRVKSSTGDEQVKELHQTIEALQYALQSSTETRKDSEKLSSDLNLHDLEKDALKDQNARLLQQVNALNHELQRFQLVCEQKTQSDSHDGVSATADSTYISEERHRVILLDLKKIYGVKLQKLSDNVDQLQTQLSAKIEVERDLTGKLQLQEQKYQDYELSNEREMRIVLVQAEQQKSARETAEGRIIEFQNNFLETTRGRDADMRKEKALFQGVAHELQLKNADYAKQLALSDADLHSLKRRLDDASNVKSEYKRMKCEQQTTLIEMAKLQAEALHCNSRLSKTSQDCHILRTEQMALKEENAALCMEKQMRTELFG